MPNAGIRHRVAGRLLRPLWRSLWEGLVAFGTLHVTGQMPPPVRTVARTEHSAPPQSPPQSPPSLAGPPPGHPERVRADVPLTAQERRLADRLPPLVWPDDL
ncbi:DUF6059 family protein [Streptomyces sp. NPDC050617]|uniref:DUF6059 family protein n=1 Tax=Streptomyces sp. NPDC050617 TaxID=3154628 RepID=UPI003415D2BF